MTPERRAQLLERYPTTKDLSLSYYGLMAAAPELAPTDAEYLEAWQRDFPKTASDWNRTWQTCPRCLDSVCEGEC